MSKETRTAYGETLAKLVVENPNIIVLDADLSGSTKTAMARKVRPEQFFNLGIAECDMMGVAAGLAASGKTVFASSFAMFAVGRPYEIIRNSIAYPQLDVKICASHAGLSVGEDGASHQVIEDLALMRAIPNMEVYCPCDQYETVAIINHVANTKTPCYVRLGRNKVEDVYTPETTFDVLKPRVLHQGNSKVAVLATGLMVQEALKASKLVDITVIDIACLKPLDEQAVLDIMKQYDVIVTAEEHSIIGGLYSAIAELACQKHPMRIVPIGVKDVFGESGKSLDVLNKYGLSANGIVEVINSL